MTKLLPIFLLIPIFLFTSVLTIDFIPDRFTLEDAYYLVALGYAGVIFLIEMSFALPEAGKSNAGVFGAVLLAGLAIGSFIFAGLIFFDLYDPQDDTGALNVTLSILILIGILMFIVQAREEIFHYKRFSFHASRLKSITG